MSEATVRGLGLAASVTYAALIGWLYVQQPQTMAEVTGGLSASIGAYRIDQQAFEDGLRFFRQHQFVPARSAFERADPAARDARTQFYIAYSYYRQGWGRLHHDDTLFKLGLERATAAMALAPGGRVLVDDPDLQMRSGDELKAELEAGLRSETSDLNPFEWLRSRK